MPFAVLGELDQIFIGFTVFINALNLPSANDVGIHGFIFIITT